ncbi:Oidioi.mRNA.OKI2018_I69.chr1.g911.t1.cds [Oikopleura dioica]|uniref:Oidioi.mRNA.OKI2018_I69.chr1.g911.t1.cds n=1 Tax=Oikopleura dioica TaxID=34765 RepID=A0ABN7SRJ9_OIKDI|nr:Oidioi.mRNA.OKI2018_I69.chr1.g911.t1.cds [Oikopleura dioica]
MLNDLDDTCEAQFQDEEEEFFESETKIMAEEIVTETINFAIELLAAEIREAEIARRLEECQAEISSENLVRPSEVRKSQRFSKNSKSQAKKPQPEASNLINQTASGEQPELKEEPEQSKDVVSNTDAADCKKEAVSEWKKGENEEKEEKTESEIEALESFEQASAERTTTNNSSSEIPDSAEKKEQSKTEINTNKDEKVQGSPKSEEPKTTEIISSPEAPKSILLFPLPSPRKSLDGEVALVTGAGSGLGAGVSKQLAAKGVTVICWDVNVKGNIETVNEINNSGGKAFAFKCDVSNREEVYAVAKESVKVAGDVTILVNNAGVVGGKSLIDSDDRMILKTFEVNAISHFWTTKAFLPKMMEKNKGHIVSIASAAGYFAVPGLTDYCASKAAAAHFADTLSMEMFRDNKDIKVSWICPYAINTGFFDGFQANRPLVSAILEPQSVIDDIVKAIETDADKVLLPGRLTALDFCQAIFPRKAFLHLCKWGGNFESMNTFRGRQKTQ